MLGLVTGFAWAARPRSALLVTCVGIACNATHSQPAPPAAAADRPGPAHQAAASAATAPNGSASAASSASGVAQPVPAGPPLAAFIGCEKSLGDWMDFALSYAEPGNFARWGWNQVDVGTGLLTVFELSEPISVFGERTSRIAFSGSGVVAFLASDSWERLVAQLRLEPYLVGSSSKIFSREVVASSEQVGDQVFVKKISLSLSKSKDYPDAVLAGCSYVLDVR
jgi:hypothetical protein